MIVMTDGVSSPGDFEALVKSIAASGITVSTVAIGDEAAGPLLQDMAERAKGHYYFLRRRGQGAADFRVGNEHRRQAGHQRRAVLAQDGPARGDAGRVGSQGDADTVGLRETRPKDGKPTGAGGGERRPAAGLLAVRPRTSMAFTSDIRSRWAAAWLGWPGFGPFWVGLVREALRKEPPRPSTLHVEQDGRGAVATLDALDAQGHFLNGAEAMLNVIDPAEGPRFGLAAGGARPLRRTLRHDGRRPLLCWNRS